MTTTAHRPEAALTLKEVDERTHDAWTAYSDSLRDLSGREYDEAESRSWDRLQRRLRQLEQRRAQLAAAPVEPPA